MGLFKKGFEESRKEKARQDEARENMGKKLWRMFIPAPERGETSSEADIHFLTEEPINFREHIIKGFSNGKETYTNYTCTGKDCPLCDNGDRPTFKGAFLVVDHREFEYTDKEGNKKSGKDQVRLLVQGTKVVSQLDRISSKYGLSNREVTFVRLGRGTETTYTVEVGDKNRLSEKEIENLLPDKIREQDDGTMNSLYDIIEEQLMLDTYNNSKGIGDDLPFKEEEDEEYDDSEAVIPVEDEEEKPKKLKLGSSGSNKTLFKPKAESSLKKNSRAKKLLGK